MATIAETDTYQYLQNPWRHRQCFRRSIHLPRGDARHRPTKSLS
jgi:hypothetical protein